MDQTSLRAGTYVTQPTGYRAFIPNALPPAPPILYDDQLLQLMSDADRALGKLEGSTESLPNPNLFVAMYVRKEAVLSSQIEGTQASLAEVIGAETKVLDPRRGSDVGDVINYILALNHGISRLSELPVSLRLIKEIHKLLLSGTRGNDKDPGEFRRSQNWIGTQRLSLERATFVPPPPDQLLHTLGEWEKFLHADIPLPILVKVGLAHAQFETIHPFLDGNGRVGRLLITFLLCASGVLSRPLLYLSYYFKANRNEYYDRLQSVRDHGEWEQWLKFFMKGVAEVSDEATEVAKKIVRLREDERDLIKGRFPRATSKAYSLLDLLFERPMISAETVQTSLDTTHQTAVSLIRQLESVKLLKEISGKQRYRVYVHETYYRMFDESFPETWPPA